MRKLHLLFWFLFMASALIMSGGCSKPPGTPLRVATNQWPGYEPLYLARAMGKYDKEDIRLLEMPSTSEVIRAYRNGVIDVAAVTLDEALLIAEYSIDFSIVLIMDYSYGGDAILAHPPIKSLGEIKGKRVGLENNALGSYMISRALETAGLSKKDITVIPLSYDEHERAFLEKEVDAVVTFEPVKTKLLEMGATLVFDSTQIPGEIVDILIVRNTILHGQRKKVKKLIDGWFFALNMLNTEPVKASFIISKRLGIEPQKTLASYKGLKLPSRDENKAMLLGKEPKLIKTLEKLSANMLESKILLKPVELPKLFLPEDVKEILE